MKNQQNSRILVEKIKMPACLPFAQKMFSRFSFFGRGVMCPPPRLLSYAYMFFVQSFSFSVSFLIKAPIASKCPATNRLRRVVPAPSWPRRIGIAESVAPSCPIPLIIVIRATWYESSSVGTNGPYATNSPPALYSNTHNANTSHVAKRNIIQEACSSSANRTKPL